MIEILQILDRLRQLSGNDQIAYLDSVKNPLLKEILEYTYDTHRKYKIDEGKYDRIQIGGLFGTTPTKQDLTIQDWYEFKTILNNLSEIKSANDLAVTTTKTFIQKFINEEHVKFLKQVLFKDLRLGLNIKKIQKVWPDFCVLYPYMGCRPFNMKNLEAVEYPAYAQTKMDGTFCNVIIDTVNKTVEYSSRQSKPQPMKGCFLDKFCDNWIGDSHFTDKFVLTGEVLVWDNKNNRPLPRKLSNGIVRREDKTQDELDRIHFTCWDFVPYENFIAKKWNVPYKDRYLWLKTRLNNFMDKLHIVNTWEVNNVQEAMERFNEEYTKGEEGVVIKSFNQIWQDGKPVGQVKIKAEKDCDLQMIEFLEGKGLYEGRCGSIRCITCDNKLEVMVKPRTPDDASEIWDNQEEYLNKILTVKYNEKIESDTKDKPSLYLPVFVEIRNDKIVADKFEDIQ